ncbi:MAG: hypothetical protein O7E52_09335 [Candidatus Poribacteria bacterium]|nr:hypothetical protein [Candidatus Poribacteria bacterium]
MDKCGQKGTKIAPKIAPGFLSAIQGKLYVRILILEKKGDFAELLEPIKAHGKVQEDLFK